MDKVLITCTQPRGNIIVNDLKNSAVPAIAVPALTIAKKVTHIPQGNFDYLLISSRHALECDLPDLPIIAVGDNTAEEARKKGMYVIHTGVGGLGDMDLSAYQNILYPCATMPTFIPSNVVPWPVYESHVNPDFTIEQDVKIICIFSLKAAQAIQKHCQPSHEILCLSPNIADVFKNHPIENLAVCPVPRYDALKQLILQRYMIK